MHGRVEVALVDDVDADLRVLAHAQRRPGNRAVVGEHAHALALDLLRHRRDPQLDAVPVANIDDLRPDRIRQPIQPRRKLTRRPPVTRMLVLVLVHPQTVRLPDRSRTYTAMPSSSPGPSATASRPCRSATRDTESRAGRARSRSSRRSRRTRRRARGSSRSGHRRSSSRPDGAQRSRARRRRAGRTRGFHVCRVRAALRRSLARVLRVERLATPNVAEGAHPHTHYPLNAEGRRHSREP